MVYYIIHIMSNIINTLIAFAKLSKQQHLSETRGARLAGISRLTWRSVVQGQTTVGLNSLISVAKTLATEVAIVAFPAGSDGCDCSTVAVSFRVLRDGPSSWKIHFMELVDEFRRSLDSRLLLLPPPNELSLQHKALLASIVVSLCWETEMTPPSWADRSFQLASPWFVSEMESLKAMSILESPLPFRRNNIFVGENFLNRA